MKPLSKMTEWKIVAYLLITTLIIHLLTIFGSFLALFSDIFLLVVLSWFLAFFLEPFIILLSQRGFSRVGAAALVYTVIAAVVFILVWTVIPTTVTQLATLSSLLPSYLPENSPWTPRVENFFAATLSNFAPLATGLASVLTGVLLVFILSFYFLISKREISDFILRLIPDKYEEDYHFLETVINTTFASFLRIQVLLGTVLGLVVFFTLWTLRVNFALATSLLSAILAFIPVVGPVLFLLPVILASLTVSLQTTLIATLVVILIAQLVYNVWAPRLWGAALRIHPIIVLLAFLAGYRLAGLWGAVFAVPVTAALAIIGRDLLLYWREEADKKLE